MSAYWGAPQSRNANYYKVRDKSSEDLRDIIALELAEDSRDDVHRLNTCKDCGHVLFHANAFVAQECGKRV